MRFENIILDILRVLPKSVLKLIAGPPLVIDGNQLDLNIQVVKKLSEKEMKKTRREGKKDERWVPAKPTNERSALLPRGTRLVGGFFKARMFPWKFLETKYFKK